MDTQTQRPRDYGFLVGLLTGTCVGAGIAMWLVPRAAEEFRDRTAESARRFSKRAAEQFRDASTRVADAASELARKGNGIRDEVADTVARGAHEVERLATAARSDRR